MPILSSSRDIVVAKIMLAIVLATYAAQASCQATYAGSEADVSLPTSFPSLTSNQFGDNIFAVPKQVMPVKLVIPAQPAAPAKHVAMNNQVKPASHVAPITPFSTATSQPSFSATLDPVIADEAGEIIVVTCESVPQLAAGPQGWFMQVDSFVWRESRKSTELLEETGPLFSVGYQSRQPKHRYRISMFGGNVDYNGCYFSYDGYHQLESSTSYVGGTIEYDFRWQFPSKPTTAIFVGIGSRLWSRTIKGAFANERTRVRGVRETWWTFYPRAGIDSCRQLGYGWQIYMSASLGLTAYTYELTDHDNTVLEPKSDLYGQAELSLRRNSIFVSLMLERIGWKESDVVDNILQPRSSMFTAGLAAGCQF